ncbi:MAG TPA: hypothetical protein DC057_10150 [Spirochaetia bacterium]|nr:hypothetical protein [Spirochaetia bacterium]
MNITEILDILPKLNGEEFKKLEDALKFYLVHSKKETQSEEILLYDSINTKIKGLTGHELFFGVFKKSKIGYKQLGECLITLNNFINLLGKHIKVTKLTRKQVYNLYTEIITEYLIKYRIPVSVNSVLNCHEKFLSLLDKKYPGYMENGLLYLVFCEDVMKEIIKLSEKDK